MSYELIVKNNPNLKIYKVTDKEFIPYGKVLNNLSIDEIIEVANKIPMPAEGSMYVPELEEFMKTKAAKEMQEDCYGEMPTQVGYCYGSSNKLNAVEWHKDSEINIATTPLVLILGKVQDIVDNKVDSSTFKIFYLEKGDAVEVYATTLHFCPCQVLKSGFGCVVGLPKGTNIPLQNEHEDKVLFRKNKWILAHVENEGLIGRGVLPGVTGENYEIRGE